MLNMLFSTSYCFFVYTNRLLFIVCYFLRPSIISFLQLLLEIVNLLLSLYSFAWNLPEIGKDIFFCIISYSV